MARFWPSSRETKPKAAGRGPQFPDPDRVSVADARTFPLLRETLDPQSTAWRALRAVQAGEDSTAAALLRQLLVVGDEAEQWFARMELGTLLCDADPPDEGLGLLDECLAAPFRDVIGAAAWNLAESCHALEHPWERPFAELARHLGDGTAIAATCERLYEAGCDSAIVTTLLESERSDCPDEIVARYLRVLALAILRGEFLVPDTLVDELRRHAANRPAAVAADAAAAVHVLDAIAADSPRDLERAAHLMLWHSRPELPWRAVHMLADATLRLDGHPAAQRLVSGFLREQPEATHQPALMLLQGRLAAAAGEWTTAANAARQCLMASESSSSVVTAAVDLLLESVSATDDTANGIAVLEDLPERLRSPETKAALAALLAKRDGMDAATQLWVEAIEAGWETFDPTFESALRTSDLSAYDVVRIVAILESRRMHSTQESLARRADCPGPALAILATSESEDVRCAAAENPGTPSEVLVALLDDTVFVLLSVAANPNVDPEVLTRLAQRPEGSIRRVVASSPRCPVEVLRQLAFDEDRSVLQAVRDNPNSPDELRALVALSL